MNRRVVMGLAVIAVGILLSGCSHSSSGGDAMGTDPGPGSAALMPFGAPKVQAPLQAGPYVENPCQSLTTQQAQAVHEDSSPYVLVKDSQGSTCEWPAAHNGTEIQISWNTQLSSDPQQPKGLDFYYSRRNDSLSNEKFVPTSVNGYPAALIGVGSQNIENTCRLALGVQDNLLATITYSANPSSTTVDQDCALAKTVAGDIISNAKGKAS